jgi:glycosyltransferase involved in cell wall biosynthesis
MILALSIAGIVIAIVPAATFLINLPRFACDASASDRRKPQSTSVSILIPARNEAEGIERSIRAALASRDVEVEVLVLDDDSSDGTGDIVNRLAAEDARVRCLRGDPLPDGWNGKQYACWQLARAARYEHLAFLDADVRLQPEGLHRLIAYQQRCGAALLSAFPHQQTLTLLETWIIPLMHFILLGFLPLRRMRASTHPAYAAGCGQWFLTRQSDYQRAGTHQAIRGSRHDGLKLPRAYRQAGLMTDVTDGTALAECRMYASAGAVIRGVLKNAVEGLANPRLIMPFTILLLGGSVLPVVTLVWSLLWHDHVATAVSLAGVITGHAPRAIAAVRFRHSLLGVICHSPATLLFVALQWIALLNHMLGRQVAWRGRTEESRRCESQWRHTG